MWIYYMGCKILKRVTWPRPFLGRFFIGRVGLAMVKSMYQIWSPRFTRYEAMNGSAKCRKWGGLGWQGGTQGHWSMPPFDRAHTTSYSTLIEINIKNCSLSIVLTATDQKPQKSLKRWYFPPSHCLNVSVMLSNMTFLMIFAVFDPLPLTLWINCSF